MNIEDRIREEYSWLKANIALHPYLATLGALLLGWAVGHWL